MLTVSPKSLPRAVLEQNFKLSDSYTVNLKQKSATLWKLEPWVKVWCVALGNGKGWLAPANINKNSSVLFRKEKWKWSGIQNVFMCTPQERWITNGLRESRSNRKCPTVVQSRPLMLRPGGVRAGTKGEVALSQDFLTEALTSVKLQGLLEAQ